MKSEEKASRIPGVPAVSSRPFQLSGIRSTNWASWWHSAVQVPPGAGVQPLMKGAPFFAVRAGSTWKALHPSGQ